MSNHPEIKLGVDKDGAVKWAVPVYAQRHAYIENRVGKFVNLIGEDGGIDLSMFDGVEGLESFVRMIGDAAYDLLAVMVPNLSKRVPKYAFRGYGSQEAYDDRDYDEREDQSPTFPQIVRAFEVAVEVNRFDVFKALKGLIDWDLLKVDVNMKLSETISGPSPSSPSPSGESAPSSSGTTLPTSESSSTPEPAPASVSPTHILSGEPLLTSA